MFHGYVTLSTEVTQCSTDTLHCLRELRSVPRIRYIVYGCDVVFYGYVTLSTVVVE